MQTIVALSLFIGSVLPCAASCGFDKVIGYTLVAKKAVVALIDDDQREDKFSGCKYGRVIVFEDNTGVRCTDYNYHYAYRPDAYIFVNSSSIKLCIDSDWFDAQSLR